MICTTALCLISTNICYNFSYHFRSTKNRAQKHIVKKQMISDSQRRSNMYEEKFILAVWNWCVTEMPKCFSTENMLHAFYITRETHLCFVLCSQKPVIIILKTKHFFWKQLLVRSCKISDWPPSTAAARVLWSKGWNIGLSENGESGKLAQVVIDLKYLNVNWRNASSSWDLEQIFGCIKWLLPRRANL